VKISNKKNPFFSSRNQYFPHIPYVASKKHVHAKLQLSILYPDGLGQIFDIFARKIRNISEKLLSDFQKFPKSSIQIYDGSTCKAFALFLQNLNF
jgi:hypothetical protein